MKYKQYITYILLYLFIYGQFNCKLFEYMMHRIGWAYIIEIIYGIISRIATKAIPTSVFRLGYGFLICPLEFIFNSYLSIIT